MPPSKNKRRAAQRRAAERKQQQMAVADSPSNANPTHEEGESETEEVFHTPETDISLGEAQSGRYLSEDVGSHSNGQERIKEFKLGADGDRNVNLDVKGTRWEDFCQKREELCKGSENFGDKNLNDSSHVTEEEEFKASEQTVTYDDKQVQELNSNLNMSHPKNSSVSFNDNSSGVDLTFDSKNKDTLVCMETETLENEGTCLKDSKADESTPVFEEESKINEEISYDEKKQVQVSSQMDEQIYPKDSEEVNSISDAAIQPKHRVTCDDKQVQVLPRLDEKIHSEDSIELDSNLNMSCPKNSSISFNDNSNNVDLTCGTLVCVETEMLENKDTFPKDSKAVESAHVIEEESKVKEKDSYNEKKQMQVSSQMDEQIYPKDCEEVNGYSDVAIQAKPFSFSGIASESSFTKTNEFIDDGKEKLENEDVAIEDSTEAIVTSSSNENHKSAKIVSSNVEKILRVDESSIPVCGDGDVKEKSAENSLKIVKETPYVIESSKVLLNTNQEIQLRADANLYMKNSKPIHGPNHEEEASNNLAFDYLEKHKEEIHFVNDNFSKPVDAVGEKTLAAMMKIQSDQSPDQNARFDETSSLVPEGTKHGKNRHGSLESLIGASDNLYVQTAEKFAESSSNTAQTANMQCDKVDSKEAGRRTSIWNCCGLLEAFTRS